MTIMRKSILKHQSSRTQGGTGRQWWLWVTKPEFYLDEDGKEDPSLDPALCEDSDGWWTCHRDTQAGDLAFLWRTRPMSDIGYLIHARSDAYSIVDDEFASERGWDYGCDYEVLHKFRKPVTLLDLRKAVNFEDWHPLRMQFQRRVFPVTPEYLQRLNDLILTKDPAYKEVLESLQGPTMPKRILLEEELEEALVFNLSILKPFGYDLTLYKDPDSGATGRQMICVGNGGRIDLLCQERGKKVFVVIELKNVRAGQNTFGQISNYMGWVQDRIAGRKQVRGLVISRGVDPKFQTALRTNDRIAQIDIERLGIKH